MTLTITKNMSSNIKTFSITTLSITKSINIILSIITLSEI
jgi:hypothetical protein